MDDFRFLCDPACLAQARRWLAARLGEALGDHPGSAAVIDDAVVITSELVTNAVQAECARGALSWQLAGDQLLVLVGDDAPGWPKLRQPGPTEVHGRGLHIVRALATGMGARSVQGGKQVWATLALPAVAAQVD